MKLSNNNNNNNNEGSKNSSIIRVKPVGAGGGGVENSGIGLKNNEAALRYQAGEGVSDGGGGRIDIVAGNVNGKSFNYMDHVIPPETDNEKLYNFFLPQRVDAFMNGYNVNLMAYGQTGTGKTHTMFGTPGIMGRAGRGDYGMSVHKDYGVFPRAALDIFARYKQLKSSTTNEKYILTAHAIELSMIMGHQDMLNKKTGDKNSAGLVKATQYGVCIDKVAKPHRMYGMEELILESDQDLFRFFSGISDRCVQGTGLNQYSSRSHCFVVLTLYCYNPGTDLVWSSRFQFVDLAGSEKLEDAHGDKDYRATAASFQGMIVNYSLTMLGQAIRALVEARRKKKKFSFRAFIFDLVLLLSQSMTGEAYTSIFVCVSQAPANAATTLNALDFGKVFSKLKLRKKKVKPMPMKKLFNDAQKLYNEAKRVLKGNPPAKYRMIREGQLRDGAQKLHIFKQLKGEETDDGGEGGGKTMGIRKKK